MSEILVKPHDEKNGILLTQSKSAEMSLPIFVDPQVFGFLLEKPETEQAYYSLVDNIKTLFEFVEVYGLLI
jgi:hypothetical protein